MWKPEQLLEGKDFDPVFAHAIVRKYPELDDILWEQCYVDRDYDMIGWHHTYFHKLRLVYKGETIATLTSGGVPEKQFYKFIMDS